MAFLSEAAVEQALHWIRQGPAEFADCLHAGLCSHAGAPPNMFLKTTPAAAVPAPFRRNPHAG